MGFNRSRSTATEVERCHYILRGDLGYSYSMNGFRTLNAWGFRAMVGAGVVALLAACSAGDAGVPMAHEVAMRVVHTGSVQSQSTSPCDIPNGWYFKGPCQQFSLPYTGKTLHFPVYHGVTLMVRFGITSVNGRDFVVGMGTNDSNITGKDFDSVFPMYGTSEGCVDLNFNTVKCRGKAVLYVLLRNPDSTFGAGIPDSPLFRLTKKSAFHGTKCQMAMLVYRGSSNWQWLELPVHAKPRTGVVTFKPYHWILSLEPGYFQPVAFHCY